MIEQSVTPELLALTEVMEQLEAIADAINRPSINRDVLFDYLVFTSGRLIVTAKAGLDGEPLKPAKPWYIGEDGKIHTD